MVNNYGIFFSRDGQVLRLPINPEKLPETKDGDNGEYNVLGIGPITVPRIPKQKEITISSYFPGRVTPGVLTANGFVEPEVYISFFRSAMDDKAVITYTPARYMPDGTPFAAQDPGFDCIVTSFTTEERGGETGDFYYDLTIREWRDYSPLTATVTQSNQSTTTTPSTNSTVLQTDNAAATITTEPTRQTEQGQLYAGRKVIANGTYYYTSYGDLPSWPVSGLQCVVARPITEAPTREYPVLLATNGGTWLGWINADALQVVKET